MTAILWNRNTGASQASQKMVLWRRQINCLKIIKSHRRRRKKNRSFRNTKLVSDFHCMQTLATRNSTKLIIYEAHDITSLLQIPYSFSRPLSGLRYEIFFILCFSLEKCAVCTVVNLITIENLFCRILHFFFVSSSHSKMLTQFSYYANSGEECRRTLLHAIDNVCRSFCLEHPISLLYHSSIFHWIQHEVFFSTKYNISCASFLFNDKPNSLNDERALDEVEKQDRVAVSFTPRQRYKINKNGQKIKMRTGLGRII